MFNQILNTMENIMNLLESEELVEMETDREMLSISFRKFFGTEKEFLFILNCKPIFDCKTKKTAIKKIDSFIDKGFKLTNI